MTDRELMQQGYEVPLVEQLDAVPRNARLWIENPNGMGSRHFPIGLMCHKAAEALRARLAQPEPEPLIVPADIEELARIANIVDIIDPFDEPQPEPEQRTGDCLLTGVCASEGHRIQKAQREWQGLTDDEVSLFGWEHAVVDEECVRAIEAKLREKNT